MDQATEADDGNVIAWSEANGFVLTPQHTGPAELIPFERSAGFVQELPDVDGRLICRSERQSKRREKKQRYESRSVEQRSHCSYYRRSRSVSEWPLSLTCPRIRVDRLIRAR